MSRIRTVGVDLNASHVRLHNFLERRTLRALAVALARFAGGLLTGRWQPMQVLLFSNPDELRRVMEQIRSASPNTVYLDSVRTAALVPLIRRTSPDCRIVMDFDDLMSRRFRIWIAQRLPVSIGYLASHFPAGFARWLERSSLLRALLRYEARALEEQEGFIADRANAIVLVSPADASLLASRKPDARTKIQAITPPADAVEPTSYVEEPVRFAFVGSDSLIQNRLSLEFLLERWRTLKPTAVLDIYGRMHGRYEIPTNVRFHGFVDDLRAGVRGAVFLVPSFVGGGVKTKVLDGFASGCAVAGNRCTFEGFDLPNYPLVVETGNEIDALITAPAASLERLRAAAEMGRQIAAGPLSFHTFARRWKSVLAPAAASS